MPALDAPSVSHLLQRGIWGDAQAGVIQVGRLERLAVTRAYRLDLHDPAGADQGLSDVLGGLLGP